VKFEFATNINVEESPKPNINNIWIIIHA